MTITQTITDPGTAPTRTDPDSFDSRADSFLTALETWGGVSGEFATYASQANALATTVNGYKTDAEAAKDDAETAQTAAEAAEDGAEAAAGATVYDAGITYAAGARVMDPGDDYALYTSQQAGNSDNTPNTDDGTWWVRTFPTVSDTAYDATSWNGNTDAATKNAIRDKFESLETGVSMIEIQVFS